MGCFAHLRRKLVEVMDVAPHTPKKSHLDTAMTYAINNEKYLRYYIEDGRVEISNNSAERCCKSFVIGRKNFLFSNSINGAKASGAAYSIIESAKINGLKPYEYIETQTYKMYQLINKLFYLEKEYDKKYKKDYDRITKERKIKSLPVLEESMPWSEELPKNLYKNKKA